MAEVLFYHLTSTALDQSLPDLLTRTLARGWRAVVRAGSQGRLDALDTRLWTHPPGGFLPHGTADGPDPAEQPIYLTTGPENPAGAEVLFLVDGARLDPQEVPAWARVCVLFEAVDGEAVDTARADWRAAREAGLTGTYWAQVDGRWVEKAKLG